MNVISKTQIVNELYQPVVRVVLDLTLELIEDGADLISDNTMALSLGRELIVKLSEQPLIPYSENVSADKVTEAMSTVEITRKVYDQLVKDSEWLSCLEAAGVDNWEGIDEAFEIRRERMSEDE